MLKRRFSSMLAAILIISSLLAQGTLVLAGTTGSINGTVVESGTRAPLAGVKVTASSPSQNASTTTDATGHFSFVSLAPDTYTVSVEGSGFQSASLSNENVFADQNQVLNITLARQLRTIGQVRARATSQLVRPGTTADVYSIDPTIATAAKGLGGGGSQNQIYSAVQAVPGAFVPAGTSGWNQPVYIRGADYDQTGYEFDGVPVNRAFDNYAAHTGSSLGNQELQVYTGGGPSNASANGLGGFINQVIKTGAYPPNGQISASLGTPAFYHDTNVEVSGALPNRNFSYYVGFLGSTQTLRVYDQYNGQGQTNFEVPLITPALGDGGINGVAPNCINGVAPATPVGVANNPGCYAFTTGLIEANPTLTTDREFVSNFHIGLPHKNGLKDDIQLLYTNSALNTYFGNSFNDLASSYSNIGLNYQSFAYHDGVVFPAGTQFGQAAAGLRAVPYLFPNSPRPTGGFASFAADGTLPTRLISPDTTDAFFNDSSIIKVQYQKNFSSNAYARIFGYTFYSDWLNSSPVYAGGAGGAPVNSVADYELDTHTRGLEFQLGDQINAQNLLQATFNYTTASVVRYNNSTFANQLGTASTNLVDRAGNCYTATGDIGLCNTGANAGTYGNPTPFTAVGAAAAAGATWIVTKPGANGTLNTAQPKFSSYSIQDQIKPTEKLTLNLGLRDEDFLYDLASTNDPGQNFWFAAARRELCYNTASQTYSGIDLTCPAGAAHPDGVDGHLLYSNTSDAVHHNVLEPRTSFTYTLTPDTVLRGSYGRYAQPPNTAAVQYNTAQPNTAAYDFSKFVAVGYTSPRHDIRPAISSNFDVSIEHHFKGTDTSFKLTPWTRNVIDQQENVYLDQATQFVSAINAGTVNASGVEFALTKGDFNRNGLAIQLAYAFTTEKIHYNNLGTSSQNTIDQINGQISTYNGYTRAGGGSPCFVIATSAPTAACGPATVANPYYASAAQPLLDRNGAYQPNDLSPAFFGASQSSYYSPHVITGIFNYKRDKFTITPSVQVNFGSYYGVPTEVLGIDPATCTANSLAIPTAVAAGRGLAADYTSCGGELLVPNPETGHFDGIGQYTQPTNLIVSTRMTYAVSSKITASVTLANLVNTCFGGSPTPWNNGGSHVCAYGLDGFNPISDYSNFYNGSGPNDVVANGATPNAYNSHAYRPVGYTNPINAYFNLAIKI